MFKSIIFLVGFMFCGLDTAYAEEPPRSATQEQLVTAVTQREPASSKPAPDIDPLAELSKLSEGDILIIEYCLGIMKYYPNYMTGKPSQKLVEAIRQYQTDRGYLFPGSNLRPGGYIKSNDLDSLIGDTAGMGLGNIIRPSERKKRVLLLEEGNVAEMSGLWIMIDSPYLTSDQDYEHLVCFKLQEKCFSNQIIAVSYNNSVWSVYAPSIVLYKIQKFDDKQVVAVKEKYYNRFSSDPSIPKKIDCHEDVLTLDFVTHSARMVRRSHADRKALPECKDQFKYPSWSLEDADKKLLMDHYDRMKDLIERSGNKTAFGQKEKMFTMLEAIKAKFKSQVKTNP